MNRDNEQDEQFPSSSPQMGLNLPFYTCEKAHRRSAKQNNNCSSKMKKTKQIQMNKCLHKVNNNNVIDVTRSNEPSFTYIANLQYSQLSKMCHHQMFK